MPAPAGVRSEPCPWKLTLVLSLVGGVTGQYQLAAASVTTRQYLAGLVCVLSIAGVLPFHHIVTSVAETRSAFTFTDRPAPSLFSTGLDGLGGRRPRKTPCIRSALMRRHSILRSSLGSCVMLRRSCSRCSKASCTLERGQFSVIFCVATQLRAFVGAR